jgi:hypothetical protein
MIKNFAELKSELKELSAIINSFKSEAVQLRIVELLFEVETPSGEGEPPLDGQQPATRRRRTRASQSTPSGSSPSTPGKKGRRSSGSGPAPTLNDLLSEGFFAKRSTLAKIIEHCKMNKARNLRQNDLSGPLGKFVRDGRLKRQKNSDGQYEYWKP